MSVDSHYRHDYNCQIKRLHNSPNRVLIDHDISTRQLFFIFSWDLYTFGKKKKIENDVYIMINYNNRRHVSINETGGCTTLSHELQNLYMYKFSFFLKKVTVFWANISNRLWKTIQFFLYKCRLPINAMACETCPYVHFKHVPTFEKYL